MNDFWDKLIVRGFGVNRFNFYGWLGAGALVFVGSLVLFLLAMMSALEREVNPVLLMLAALYLVLIGLFGLLLQLYCSLMAEKLTKPAKLEPPDRGRAEVPDFAAAEKSNAFAERDARRGV